MTGQLLFGLTFLSALGAGLIAGLFFAFSSFVMTALSRIPSVQGIAAMQSINVAVLNPLFALVFFGTALACIALAIQSFFRWGETGTIYVLAGSLFYLVGFLVTIAFNVPLNDSLASVDPNSAAGADLWKHYIVNWTAWNHVRTVASLAALASFIIALRYR
ncbi:DUF1772 domain-containing protein [Brevibacillus choshinensis]|uniref:DUF1772 domain-containing protein n=1 Tax=Brevibacillus choshinensis TaxID=54911 RepID=A0ABX7FJE1_BRECH|nr:anthrone oxygenase family protein [Brevibacillus choshinensis]QRG66206.1 DUF1772 domain-containing protein [Brevibacillus choshinensis]